MKIKSIFMGFIILILVILNIYLLNNQIKLENKITFIAGQIDHIKNIDELTLKKLTIINKFGNTAINLDSNDNHGGIISLYNKSKFQTVIINGGNKNEHPGLLTFKKDEVISFALMVQEKRNLLNIYNDDGLDVFSIGTDDQGNGGYKIQNAHKKVIKTEGWDWRAYNY
ncbi:MAG: hypothetical protein GF353_06515 [Candidatus Lokiarchaeota archaeon]|nr:hypothetical protein [Candidatus Lokiarchaeota archaeon]